MSVTPEQKRVIDSVLSINETGKLPSPATYATVTVLSDGAGISYGKHQSTDGSGSLDAIIFRYIDLGGSLADQMKPFLDDLKADFSTKVDPHNLPQEVIDLMDLLAQAGSDPVMQQAQDQIFDENYWTPAVQRCEAMGLTTALAHLAVYDTCIHSGPSRVDSLRRNFPEASPATGGEEHAWVRAFLNARHAWLVSNPNPLVVKSADRVTAILKIADSENWDLVTPFLYRFGITIP